MPPPPRGARRRAQPLMRRFCHACGVACGLPQGVLLAVVVGPDPGASGPGAPVGGQQAARLCQRRYGPRALHRRTRSVTDTAGVRHEAPVIVRALALFARLGAVSA